MFSVNQNRQLYVVKAWKETALEVGGTPTPGDCALKNDGHNYFFEYINAKGEAIRSDLINPSKLNYVRVTAADDALPKGHAYTIGVNSSILSNSSAPAGKHYIIRLNFRKVIGVSEENTAMVFGDYYTETATASTDLLKNLAVSLAKNIAADKTKTKLAKIMWGTDEVTAETDPSDLSSGSLIISEVAQDWTRGKGQFAILPFSVSGNKITIDGVDASWLEITDDSIEEVEEVNGKLVADLEWFCAGEKGDQYRGMGWPNNIDTEYMVDPSLSYDLIDISYYYSGDNEDVQHSTKLITLACAEAASSDAQSAVEAMEQSYVTEGVIPEGEGNG